MSWRHVIGGASIIALLVITRLSIASEFLQSFTFLPLLFFFFRGLRLGFLIF